MHVKLVSLTQPQVYGYDDKLMDAEGIIAYCARVSNPKNQHNVATAPKLLKFLIKHKHWSPFELANMCVEIKTSRAIAAQILRHRSFSFQEFSQRYSEATEMEPVELRAPAEKNRQSSSKIIEDEAINTMVEMMMDANKQLYEQMIAGGVAKECARMILPLGTQTTMYMNGTVRSWIHYINLRTEENTQKEHRDIANAVKNIFIKQFPNVSEALDWKAHEWSEEELEKMQWDEFQSYHKKPDESTHE
ncbi:thymidylate synthase (FAD) [Candidatus Pacearchaeota archaeon]|jgi:thymidylate synthase (FAD)|nr:thymidylate synthase (FAD) [Candidatus Pacearchaeota archaeon]|tara:strand:- start:353 stop:1093 length:741 start_codon:yes stop_codon:yes gene_type:complete